MNDCIVKPQEGFQTTALSTDADIAILGGAAGAGKTFVMQLEALRHIGNPKMRGLFLRRESTQVLNPGGLWDSAQALYNRLPKNIRPVMSVPNARPTCKFPSGAQLVMSHLNQEKDVFAYQGAEIPVILFDELTHFTETQFWYMLSRNRSTSGIKPYVRATCNPQGDGWVKNMIAWYLYPDDYPDQSLAGYPRRERVGILRYFTRFKNALVWGNTPDEVLGQLPEDVKKNYTADSIKSFTFIPGLLKDNKVLTSIDPSYIANLLALDDYDREQLLGGRWLKASDDAMRMYDPNAVKDIFTNSFVQKGHKYLTADIALEGSDAFVVGLWDGWRLYEVHKIDKSDGAQVLAFIEKMARQHGVPQRNICFDADGVGGFLKGFLRNAISFHGNGMPYLNSKKVEKQNYENARAQIFYFLRNIINNYEMFAEIPPQYARLLEDELNAILKAEKSISGKLRLIPKSEIKLAIKRSPDFADMVALRAVFDLLGRDNGSERRTISI
jgi:hypothetical protein